jgi:hypothetical protein
MVLAVGTRLAPVTALTARSENYLQDVSHFRQVIHLRQM